MVVQVIKIVENIYVIIKVLGKKNCEVLVIPVLDHSKIDEDRV